MTLKRKPLKKITFIFLFLLVFLSACAGPTQEVRSTDKKIIGGVTLALQSKYGCLPACLKMVMQYYGVDVSMEKIENTSGTTAFGTNWKGVPAFLEGHGLKIETIPFSDIKRPIDARTPVIVSTKGLVIGQSGHVVVVAGYKGDDLYIMDPARGGPILENHYTMKYGNEGRGCYVITKKA